MPFSSTTITLENKTYKVFPGGLYSPTDPPVQEAIDQYGLHFMIHGESLSPTLMRYWQRELKVDSPDGWVYVKRDEEMADLPTSFWLLKVQESES